MQLTQADWLEIEREACKRSLSTFVREAWHVLEPGQPYRHGWHIDFVCEHLAAVTYGEISRLLINIPPGTMKSLLTNVFWPAWEWGPIGWAHIRFIGASHEEGLATRDNMKMRRLISSEWYQTRWPVKMVGDQNQKTYFENVATGWRQSCAVRAMTGKRGDRVVWDDPLNVEGAHSAAERATTIRELRETLPTRLNNPDRSAIVMVMQRLHEGDPSGFVLKEKLGWEHLCLPMEFEPSRRCVTSIGLSDPRKEKGELLFPERFPREVVERDKKLLGDYGVAGQFQQMPAPLGGGLLKDKWWQYYATPPRILWRAIYADTAQKTGEQNDYSVFQCWGMSEDGRAVFLDQIRGRWEAPDLLIQARAFWNKHKETKGQGVLRAIKVEDKSSGTGLIQQLARGDKAQQIPAIPVLGIPRDRDKVSRVMDIAPRVQAGLVLLPVGAPWLSGFLAETSAFPNADNDDQVDPMVDAIVDMLGDNNARRAGVW
jgi:predicted phage terminase large subunit-like protein